MRRLLVVLCIVALVAEAGDAAARKRRRKGVLELTSPISGAKVTIDGKNAGKTPVKRIPLREGTYTLKVKKLGFLDFSQKVQVKAGKTVTVNADLLPFAGVINVTSNVRRAAVLVDGTAVGKVPLEREVGIGKRAITVRAPGYGDYTEEIAADPGKRYTIQARLEKGSQSEPGGADLALVPLGGSGGGEATDDLALEPLARAGGDDDALALVPLEPAGGGDSDGPDTAGAGDDLALEALPVVTPSPAGDVVAIDPAMMPPGLGATVEPAKPWYFEWWALTAAGVVVVAGASVGIYYATRGEEQTKEVVRWKPGDYSRPDTIPAIIAF